MRDERSVCGVIDQCPIVLGETQEPRFLQWTALAANPSEQSVQSLYAYEGPEIIHVRGDNLYTYYTDGVGRSKLTMDLIERRLKTTGTGRNWNTVLKIAAMLDN